VTHPDHVLFSDACYGGCVHSHVVDLGHDLGCVDLDGRLTTRPGCVRDHCHTAGSGSVVVNRSGRDLGRRLGADRGRRAVCGC
jgi:hypothetical protein